MVILSLLLIQDGLLSVSNERMCTSTGKSFRGISLHRKNVVRYTDWLHMTRIVLTGPLNSKPTTNNVYTFIYFSGYWFELP